MHLFPPPPQKYYGYKYILTKFIPFSQITSVEKCVCCFIAKAAESMAKNKNHTEGKAKVVTAIVVGRTWKQH